MPNLNLQKLTKGKKLISYIGLSFIILTIMFSIFSKRSNLVFAQTAPTTSFELQVDPNAPFTAQGGTFNLLLVARSDIESSNLFSAKITFPANELTVQSINSDTNTFIKEKVETTYSNTSGTINIVGGYSGGYKTNSSDNPSTMATITFQRSGPDPVTLHFTPSTSSNVNQTAIFSNTSNHNILVSSPDLTLNDSNIPAPTPTPTDAPCQNCTGGPPPPGPDTGDGGSTPSHILGDIDNNGKVDVFDLSKLLIDWNTSTAEADLDTNGTVDVFDLSILLINWTY